MARVALVTDSTAYLPADLVTPFCGSIYMCNAPGSTDAGTDVLKNAGPERARQLLKESGYKGEPVVVFHSKTSALLNPIGMIRMAMRQTDAEQSQPATAKLIQHGWRVIGGIHQQRFPLIVQDIPLYTIPVDGSLHHLHPWWHALGNRLPLIDRDLRQRLRTQAQRPGQRTHLRTVSWLIATFQRRNIAAR